MIDVGTEIQFLIEPICLIYSVSRGIIRGKLISSKISKVSIKGQKSQLEISEEQGSRNLI